MDEFEKLLANVSSGVERFVRYRLPSQTDADDVLQEVYLSAYRSFPSLKNKESFKAWILSIARNKCNDYFRARAAQMEISIEELSQQELSTGRLGISVVHTVRETLDRLGDKDKQILYLYFWKELPQNEIAKMLNIPMGTVKSRLHTAKQHFESKYPYQTQKPKGELTMQKLPEYIPDYTIERLDAEPFTKRDKSELFRSSEMVRICFLLYIPPLRAGKRKVMMPCAFLFLLEVPAAPSIFGTLLYLPRFRKMR